MMALTGPMRMRLLDYPFTGDESLPEEMRRTEPPMPNLDEQELVKPTSKDKILAEILAERLRQDELKAKGKFPNTCADDISNDRRNTILCEEYLEVVRAANELEDFVGTSEETQKKLKEALRSEVIQVAAVCMAWAEGLDRG